METQALGSAPRQGRVLPTGCVCTLVQMFQLGLISSLLFHFLLWDFSCWFCLLGNILLLDIPSVIIVWMLLCSSSFFSLSFPFTLLFSLLLQVFLDIQNIFNFSPASDGQMVTREMCRWLKQMFLSKSKYLTPESLLDIASDEHCQNGGQGLVWLLFTLQYFNLHLWAFRRIEGCWEKLLLFPLPC